MDREAFLNAVNYEVIEPLFVDLKNFNKWDSGDTIAIPPKMMLTEADAFEVISDFFGKLDCTKLDTAKTFYVHMTKLRRRVSYDGVCHYDFRDRKDEGNLGSASQFFDEDTNKDITKTVLAWMKKKTFPWKALVPHLTPLYNLSTGRQTGFYISTEGMKLSFPLIRNFFIFLRVASEKPRQLQAFANLVAKGMDERDAFYLCSFLKEYKGQYYQPENDHISGWHWPLCDYGFFDWKAWYSGDASNTLSYRTQTTNHIWMRQVSPYYSQFSIGIPEDGLSLDTVIQKFTEWKEKNVRFA